MGEGLREGESCAGEQIVYVRLVAEGSARGKERHETERFLGLAGTFFHVGVSQHFSLPLILRLIFHSRFPPIIHLRPLATAPVSPLVSPFFPPLFPPFFNLEPLPPPRCTLSPQRTYVRTPRRYTHIDLRSSVSLGRFEERNVRGSRRFSPGFSPLLSFSLSRVVSVQPLNLSPVVTGRAL